MSFEPSVPAGLKPSRGARSEELAARQRLDGKPVAAMFQNGEGTQHCMQHACCAVIDCTYQTGWQTQRVLYNILLCSRCAAAARAQA